MHIKKLASLILFFILVSTSQFSYANICSNVKKKIDNPKKLLVVVPATGHTENEHWKSFYKKFVNETEANEYGWLFINHNVDVTSLGNVRDISKAVVACIDGKMASDNYESITLLGHSVGGMIVREAYLAAAGQFKDYVVADNDWSGKVEKILLFASVNRGVPKNKTNSIINWMLENIPHPKFMLEDALYGSEFIASVRIAWIRYFALLKSQQNQPLATRPKIPMVVQFWGTKDSVVTEEDNADLEAFNKNILVRIADAEHGDLIRFESEYTNNATTRWLRIKTKLFGEYKSNVKEGIASDNRRILIILNGIRDSSNSTWVKDLKDKAQLVYGESNVHTPEYGYITAANFAVSAVRRENIPRFRDLYTEILAEYPLAEFDFIGHSNGTYVFAESLLSSVSMKFKNVVLAAPVLPTDFNWNKLFKFEQVQSVRYDSATKDWPVGILCRALNAVGIDDVGPSGVLLFDGGRGMSTKVKNVGWFDGGHSIALSKNNLDSMLSFANDGKTEATSLKKVGDIGYMRLYSNITRFLVWLSIIGIIYWLFKGGRKKITKRISIILVSGAIIYIVLSVV